MLFRARSMCVSTRFEASATASASAPVSSTTFEARESCHASTEMGGINRW